MITAVKNFCQILAISVAEFVAENKKPPDNQEVLSFDLQSVGESNPCYQDENLAS
jgi:hypothetical protein